MAGHDSTTRKLGKLLGVASLGLGAPMLIKPERVSQAAGVDDSASSVPVIRMVGVRELGHAAGLLLGSSRWAWTRVAGDAMDLAVLGRAARERDGNRRKRALLAAAAVLGITTLDAYTALRTRRAKTGTKSADALRLQASVTISQDPETVYRFWRDLSHLPTFMYHLQSVEVMDERLSHWVANAPLRKQVEWDAEITADVASERLAWRSADGSDIPNSGEVRFAPAPGNRGTEVRVQLEYQPPGGRAGKVVAKLLGEEPEQQIRDDLRRLKQVLETGEVVLSDGSPAGTAARQQLKQRPAQPLPTTDKS